MVTEALERYSTAIFAYTPPQPDGTAANEPSRDPQAVQAALSSLIDTVRQAIEARIAKGRTFASDVPSVPTTRWFLQIRSLRLAVPSEGQSATTTRTMYMVRNAVKPDAITLVIEDAARAAVNISSLSANAFDYYMSTNLLMPMGAKDANGSGGGANLNVQAPAQQGDPREQLHRTQSSRWIPRPSFVQIEGAIIDDAASDMRICIGMANGRGGTAASSSTTSPELFIQLEYLPFEFLSFPLGYGILEEYLAALLPKHTKLRHVSAETTNLDWRSLLGVPLTDPKTPAWTSRNTSWCLVKLCKEAKIL